MQCKSRAICSAITLIFMTLSANTLAMSYSEQKAVAALIDKKMRIDGIPGVSYTVVEGAAITLSGALGLADVETGDVATPDTVYRAASLTKPLTATAILQLQLAGKIDLDAPVWHYCKEFPVKPAVVTTRQLLTHTAGVRTYAMPWSVYEAELFSARRYESVPDALAIFADDPLLYEPGTSFTYTSYGYNVLGCVIETVSEMSYEDYLDQYILKPAGMKNTLVARSEAIVSGRAGTYRKNAKGNLVNERYVDLTNKIPSGGLLTTANDMARFAIAYMNGTLLPKDVARSTYQPTMLADEGVSYYGMGWDISHVESDRRGTEMYHVGVTPGVTGIMYLYPEAQSAVVVFGNLFNVSDAELLAQSIEKVIGLNSPNHKLLSSNSD